MDTEKMIKRIQLLSLSCELKTEEGIRHFHNGHEYVEIGGIKWATMNIGANSVTDFGFYFQWGDTQGYTADQVDYSREGQKYFGWSDYKYSDGASTLGNIRMVKYNSTDKKTVLDLEDDAVRANWGGQWRMPTNEEMKSLRNAVNVAFTFNYQGSGVAGVVFTSNADGTTLFIPAAGYAINGIMGGIGRYGSYWSSSLYSNAFYGCDLFFDIAYCNIGNNSRCYGFSIRGVVD